MRFACIFGALALCVGSLSAAPAAARGDLTAQEPIVVKVELGTPAGEHRFVPSNLSFETGKLYKLVLANPSASKHYFTSHGLAKSVFTRKVQFVDSTGTKAEVKGVINEIEVYPGGRAEWWFVPIATGNFSDLHCHVKDADGRVHTAHGMTGTIQIK